MERTAVCRVESFYEFIRKQVVSSVKAASVRTKMREFLFSWTQKHYHIDATTSISQRKLDEPSFVFLRDTNGSLTKIRNCTSSDQSARFVAQFEESVVRRDWIQGHVLHDTRRRHAASTVESILFLFLTEATMFTRQHFQHHKNMMEGSRTTYQRKR